MERGLSKTRRCGSNQVSRIDRERAVRASVDPFSLIGDRLRQSVDTTVSQLPPTTAGTGGCNLTARLSLSVFSFNHLQSGWVVSTGWQSDCKLNSLRDVIPGRKNDRLLGEPMRLLPIVNRLMAKMGAREDLRPSAQWPRSKLPPLPRRALRRTGRKLLGKTSNGTGNFAEHSLRRV